MLCSCLTPTLSKGEGGVLNCFFYLPNNIKNYGKKRGAAAV